MNEKTKPTKLINLINQVENGEEIRQELLEIFKGIQKEGENGEARDCAATAKFWVNQLNPCIKCPLGIDEVCVEAEE